MGYYKSPHDRGILAIDHSNKRIALGKIAQHIELSWSDISAVEIERNGQSLSQTNRGSQVMGAAIGGALLGPIGLLIGGTSGSSRQKQRLNELSLKVLVDHRIAPVHRIVFFRMGGNGIDARSSLLKESTSKLEHFHALLANAIRYDNRSFARETSQPVLGVDVADQIGKLWELRQVGALTESEFAAEKAAILISSQSMPQSERLISRSNSERG